MISNYFKVAFRIFQRQRVYSLINVGGLAIGLSCTIILLLWIKSELSYDRYHENADKILRVTSKYEVEGKVDSHVGTPSPLAPILKERIPGINNFVRFSRSGVVEVVYQEKRFFESIYRADPSIFDIFTFPLIRGDKSTVLQDPNSILISEAIKEKYFGDHDPVGEVLTLYGDRDYIITGIFRNVPENSHFRFDFLISFTSIAERRVNDWGVSNYLSYILTTDEFDREIYESMIPGIIEEYKGRDARYVYKIEYRLQNLTDIHLHSNLRGEFEGNGNMANIYTFSVVGLFLLFIACFNYVNLSTAKYSTRTREVGIRKVMGSSKIQLIKQFLSESLLFSLTALVLAIALVELILPTFNTLIRKNLDISYSGNLVFFIQIVIVGAGVGLLSGIYPAFLLSNFNPVNILKGALRGQSRGLFLRKGLIVVQFSISSILIVSLFILINQMDYVDSKDLGLNKDQIVNISINDKDLLDKISVIKNELVQHPDIISVSATSYSPLNGLGNQNYWYEGLGDNMYPAMNWISVDQDFVKTYGLELISGRDFSGEIPSDIEKAYILSESAAKEVGWNDPLGQPFKIANKGIVIGIVKDFHFKSLHERIGPIALNIYPEWYNFISVRIDSQNLSRTIDQISRKWKEFSPRRTFEYTFLDEEFGRLYESEKILKSVFTYAACLAIIIATLGLFGLVAYETQRRNKEIGIRKVLGADIRSILILFWKEFFKWILLANVFAVPVIYMVMSKWLDNFAYRIDISWSPFVWGAGAVMFIAIGTISIQAIKAALQDPVDTLKYE